MAAFDPVADLAELRRLQDALDALLTEDRARLARVVAAVSGWSSEKHLAHVALANELVLRNLASLAAGKGAWIVRGGEPHPLALSLLEQGRLPRGQAQAPRMVRPPERVERALLAQWLADGKSALDALDPSRLEPSELKVPHQLLGPLDAPQWARFGAVHTRHHLTIVHEILGDGHASARGAAVPTYGPRMRGRPGRPIDRPEEPPTLDAMTEEEAADALARRVHSRPRRESSPPSPADPEQAQQRAAGAQALLRRMAGQPASDVLARISNGDPLSLYSLGADRVRERYYVIDPDRLLERTLAVVAVGLETERERCTQPGWLLEKVDRAIRLLLEKDRDDEEAGIPPEDPEANFSLFVQAFFREPSLARLSAVRLNALEERVRKGFYKLLLDGLQVEECLEQGLGPPERLQLDVLIALQAIGLLDAEGVEELRWKGGES